jgi:dethiobiotin synthetase
MREDACDDMTFLDDWKAKTVRHANKPDTQGNPPHGIFVIGTDTDVGKTYASCVLVSNLRSKGVRIGVYKPVASGVHSGAASDAERLIAASGLPWPVERVCPQSFAAPLAPPLAAAREGRRVDVQRLAAGAAWWREQCDLLVIEGAGGALSPLAEDCTVLDLASQLGYPIVLVAAHRLGMINHTLLTLEAIERRGLTTLAVIINQVMPSESETAGDLRVSDALQLLRPLGSRLQANAATQRDGAAPCSNLQYWMLEHQGTALSPVPT